MSRKNNKTKSKKGKSKKPKRRKPIQARPAEERAGMLQKRVGRMLARANGDETPEDLAVIDHSAIAKLPDEVAAEVQLVRDALTDVAERRDSQALERLGSISRRSPMSDWRLLIRGLVDWYQDRFEQAEMAFARLTPSRRPARIAETLNAARKLAQANESGDGPSGDGPSGDDSSGDGQRDGLIDSGAKFVYRLRVERPALAEARQVISRLERQKLPQIPSNWFGPDKFKWLRQFILENRSTEPLLIQDLQRLATLHAASAPYVDHFELVCRVLPGPPHDPRHHALAWEYHGRFEGGERDAAREQSLYLRELRTNTSISPSLRSAIESEIHLRLAEEEIVPNHGFSHFMRDEDTDKVIEHFRKAIKAYPTHPNAHEDFVRWIRTHSDNDGLRKSYRETFEELLIEAMQTWSSSLPEAIEPRLFLVDFYLDAEDLAAAEPHVEHLARSRHPDPKVRSIRWKWHLLEAMRRCRRKSWLHLVDESLDAAEQGWPAWFDRRWLTYLRAALALRSKAGPKYEEIRAEARASLGPPDADLELLDAVMMLGAAQRMRVPAADLKPLRQPVDDAVKKLGSLSNESLIHLGRFCCDLHRAELQYPAYRMHGSKFAAELARRVKQSKFKDKSDRWSADEFWSAMFWLAYHNSLLNTSQDISLPKRWDKLQEKTRAYAVEMYMAGRARYLHENASQNKKVAHLREYAAQERDPYLRYWFGWIADEFENRKAAQKKRWFF